MSALVIYLMAGPDTPELAEAAVEGGADLVELGFPFSDPLADGPVIRRAAERALAQGMRTAACLECLAKTRERVRRAARADDLRVAPRGLRLRALRGRRRGGRRDEPDRRRPPRRRAPRPAPHPARRTDFHRRAPGAGRRPDGRLALPRHPDRDDRGPRTPLPAPRGPRLPGPGADRRAALRRLRHLDPRARAGGRGAGRRRRRRLAGGRGRRGRAGRAARLRPLAPERHRRRRPRR